MPRTKLFTWYDADQRQHETELPVAWAICCACEGEGKSSAYLGSFTREDFDEDPEFAELYTAGGYDRICHPCHGAGKVLEIDRDACTDEEREALEALDAAEVARAEIAAEQAAERRMGA